MFEPVAASLNNEFLFAPLILSVFNVEKKVTPNTQFLGVRYLISSADYNWYYTVSESVCVLGLGSLLNLVSYNPSFDSLAMNWIFPWVGKRERMVSKGTVSSCCFFLSLLSFLNLYCWGIWVWNGLLSPCLLLCDSTASSTTSEPSMKREKLYKSNIHKKSFINPICRFK